jgi:hypothetical protein
MAMATTGNKKRLVIVRSPWSNAALLTNRFRNIENEIARVPSLGGTIDQAMVCERRHRGVFIRTRIEESFALL